MQKYALLRQRIMQSSLVSLVDMVIPHAATNKELCLAHASDFIRRVDKGELSQHEIRALGFPWSPELVHRSKRSSGATVEACRAALQDGIAISLAGGTHHAFYDRAEAFCVFNDSAVAARVMLSEKRVKHVIIIDCDVHQGNGTAAILAADPEVFTFSIHGRNNFPKRKERSDLDIALPDGTADEQYLEALRGGLDRIKKHPDTNIAIYLAGADPFMQDRYGRLGLTKAGLLARDQLVFDYCQSAGIPVAVTMAGGYAPRVEDVVDIHFQTVQEAVHRLMVNRSRPATEGCRRPHR